MADYGRAVDAESKNALSYLGLAIAYLQRGEIEQSLANLDQAIIIAPKDTNLYRWRAIARVSANRLSDAADDLEHLVKLQPRDIYAQLWLEIVQRRRGEALGSVEGAGQIDSSKWPAPVAKLLHGEINLEAVMAVADDRDPLSARGRSVKPISTRESWRSPEAIGTRLPAASAERG